jgi:2,3-diketo-5-methylthio-1-phosphopentane phosphatase
MGSTLPIALPALKTNPKFIFFTDFDGTITQQDSNDFMTDNLGFGAELRRQGNQDVLFGRRDFRDAFRDMLDSIKTPFSECIDILRQNITLDPGFKAFFEWARENNVPIVVLSGGMEPVIRALLAHMLGQEAADSLQIVSNDVAPREGMSIDQPGGWQIVYHDDRSVSDANGLKILRVADEKIVAGLATTSPSRSARTRSSRRSSGRSSSMQVMACLTSRRPRRPTCCLPRPGAVCSVGNFLMTVHAD